MGKRNRKKVRAGHGHRPPPRQRTRPGGPSTVIRPDHSDTPHRHDPVSRIEGTFAAALRQFDGNRGALAGGEIDALAHWWSVSAGDPKNESPGLIPELICSHLCARIGSTWQRGWQPADVPRVILRHMTARHAQLAVTAIGLEAETYRSGHPTLPSWLDQLDEIGATLSDDRPMDLLAAWTSNADRDRVGILLTAFELMAMLRNLPTLPQLCPPPSAWGRSAALDAALSRRRGNEPVEIRYLERVRALLAKAESTEFDEEAEALTAKAQELMTRHSIDAALLAAHAAGAQAGEQPTGVRIGVVDPYARAKAYLLTVIGNASRCRSVWNPDFGFATVFGFEGDLGSVELLYTSLLLQARRAMEDAGRLGQRARSRSFRNSFLIGFATRIGDRLKEAADATIAGADHEQGHGLLPVLQQRSRQVEDLSEEAFGNLRGMTLSARDGAGWVTGTTAADRAELSRGPHITPRPTGGDDQVVLPSTALPPDRTTTSGRVW